MRTIAALCLAALLYPISCGQAAADDLVGAPATYTVQKGDSVSAVARRFDVGAVELLAANPEIAGAKLRPGQVLTLPLQHIVPAGALPGIVINLAEMRLFYISLDGQVKSFPISVGREGWATPTGTTSIILKRKNPAWTPPASIRAEDPSLPAVVPAGPKNPLGRFALSLGWPGYLIHGTNAPSSIGKPASHGCIRMYPEDIEALFGQVEVGTPVVSVDAPVKLGRMGGDLYVEVTPTRAQAAAIARYRKVAPLAADDPALSGLWAQLLLLQGMGEDIDYAAVLAAISRHDGMPTPILRTRAPARQDPAAATSG